MSPLSREPAAIIGLIASIVVLIAQQIITSGIVTSDGGLNVLNLIVSVVPLVAGLIIRQFVTPAP